LICSCKSYRPEVAHGYGSRRFSLPKPDPPAGQLHAHLTFSATGNSFSIHEWRGSGPATLHVHHSDDEAWHVLEGELTFHYADRTETAGRGATVFVPAGIAHTYTAGPDARYLINLTPRLNALIATLQADRDPAHQQDIYQRFDSQLLE
jgi:quercetin dioxygenase-like cupin family protein